MASRRMFSIRLINSARFLKMPISSQALYFHLGLHADDDGIVEAYTVLNNVGCSEDDLRVLASKGFIQVLNEDLVSYITDWNENNFIRADRKVDSIYQNLLISMNPEIKLIERKERADKRKKIVDNQRTTNGQPMDGIGKDRIGKDRIGQYRVGEDRLEQDSVSYQQIADMYNDTCVSFPRLTTLSDARKKAIKARLKAYTIDDFQLMFEKAEQSSFLKGSNNRNWSANFDWMIKDSNMAKILDGNYDNRSGGTYNKDADELQQAYDMMKRWAEED